MIALRAPHDDVQSVTYEGVQYPVENGVVEVPHQVAAHLARFHGFRLNSSANADEQLKIDIDGAIAKAMAAVEVEEVVMRAPNADIQSAVIEGVTYDVVNSLVTVPASAAHFLQRHGFVKVEEPAGLRDEAPVADEVVLEDLNVFQLRAWLKQHGAEVTDTRAKRLDLLAMANDLLANSKALRTDGPTLAEFVAAGYKAENYPPQGYAAKE